MKLTSKQIKETLRGTKYEGAVTDMERDCFHYIFTDNEPMKLAKSDALENAARVILLQRELESVKAQRDKLMEALLFVHAIAVRLKNSHTDDKILHNLSEEKFHFEPFVVKAATDIADRIKLAFAEIKK